MKLRHLWVATAATASLAALSACNSDTLLSVKNTNQPDVGRAFATPDGVENVLKNGFLQTFGATHGSTTNIWAAAQATALESYGSVANFGLAQRGSIPRSVIDNTRGNPTQAENFRDFQQLFLRGRLISNAIGAFEVQLKNGASIGTALQDQRARSFGYFSMGMANGEGAMMYDSIAVVTPQLTSTEIPPLTGYKEAMAVALLQLDSAIAIATRERAARGNVSGYLPIDWMRTTSLTSLDEYLAMMRSMKARFRAGNARNPAERAAVNWAAVEADAAAGIKSDWVLELSATVGWTASWLNQMAVSTGWSGMTPAIIGMADTTSGYATWVATERGARAAFLISTPDARFPKGATRTAQIASSPALAASLPSIYFRARTPGEDTPDSYTSFYDHARFTSYRQGGSVGSWVWMSQTEIDMLRAEALIALGRASEAVPLINRTRVRNTLPPYPDAASRAPAQPGGSATSCVPRTPTGPGGTLECGTLFEGMKWEKRMETQFTGWSQWFFDSRGWNDLPAGSPLMYPVPYQEMDARQEPFYNGKVGDPIWQAVGNTYGFGIGNR
ncbi:MAG: hypothetical protein JWN79_2901 [Gemmatimonadetes bacterium]|jgi:hypothetical protein|nr:hypothetical protein [Gemmatimonadota bacterium]